MPCSLRPAKCSNPQLASPLINKGAGFPGRFGDQFALGLRLAFQGLEIMISTLQPVQPDRCEFLFMAGHVGGLAKWIPCSLQNQHGRFQFAKVAGAPAVQLAWWVERVAKAGDAIDPTALARQNARHAPTHGFAAHQNLASGSKFGANPINHKEKCSSNAGSRSGGRFRPSTRRFCI